MATASQATPCQTCGGTGVINVGGKGQVCPVCEGTGKTEPQYLRLPFWYIINPATVGQVYVAASTAVTGALQIEPRADFEWVWLAATSTSTFTSEFTDASGRTYQNLPVNNLNQWGTAQLPFALIVPVVLPMRTALNYKITDTSTQNNTIQLALIGYELYTNQ